MKWMALDDIVDIMDGLSLQQKKSFPGMAGMRFAGALPSMSWRRKYDRGPQVEQDVNTLWQHLPIHLANIYPGSCKLISCFILP